MLRVHVKPGQPITARQWEDMGRIAKRSQPRSVGDGSGDFASMPTGVAFSPNRDRRRPVFVVGITGTGRIAVKEAIRTTAGGWTVSNGPAHIGYYIPWAGYSVEAFNPFVLADPDDVAEGELSCEADGDFLIPPSGGGVGGGLPGFIGQVLEVNYPKQLCVVAPMKLTTDPTDAQQWAAVGTSFEIESAVCCWTGGWTGVQRGMPVKVHMFANSPLPIVTPLYNLTGPDAERFCRPAGPFSPEGELNCETVEDDVELCLERACCLPDGTCNNRTETICNELEGTYFADWLCEDPEIQVGCVAPGACCVDEGGPNCECHFVRPFECDELGGSFKQGVDCNTFDCCDQIMPCCLPPAGATDCNIFNTTGCVNVRRSVCMAIWTNAGCEETFLPQLMEQFAQCPDCASMDCTFIDCTGPGQAPGVCCGGEECAESLDNEDLCNDFGGTWIPGGTCDDCTP